MAFFLNVFLYMIPSKTDPGGLFSAQFIWSQRAMPRHLAPTHRWTQGTSGATTETLAPWALWGGSPEWGIGVTSSYHLWCNVCTCKYIYIYTLIHVSSCTCMHAYIYVYICTHMLSVYIYICIYMHMYIYIYTCICICFYLCI